MNPYMLKTKNVGKKIVAISHERYRYHNKAKLLGIEKHITDNESQKAIFQLANNNFPGLYCFSIEFL